MCINLIDRDRKSRKDRRGRISISLHNYSLISDYMMKNNTWDTLIPRTDSPALIKF